MHVFVTVSNPPQTVPNDDDVDMAFSGAQFVAQDAGFCASFVVVTAKRLIVRVQTPAALAAALVNGTWSVCVCVCVYVRMWILACICLYVCLCVCICMYAMYVHACVHVYVYLCIHTFIHTHI